MATSGSVSYNNTQTELISAALRKLGQLAEGETATAQQIQDASGDFNRMVKAWQAAGIHLWTYQELVLFPQLLKSKFLIGATGDRCTTEDDFIETTISVAAVLGDATVTVADATGIVSGDQIGIIQDDLTIHWTTVNGAPAANVITLTDVTTAAASIGNSVYSYTNIAQRPTKITQARLQQTTSSEVEMDSMSRSDYFRLANKTATGVPTQYYYNPSLVNGELYIWPQFGSVNYRMNMTVARVIEDFTSLNDNADFPQEWLQAFVFNLAKEIGLDYGVDEITYNRVYIRAKETFEFVSGWDREGDIIIEPDFG